MIGLLDVNVLVALMDDQHLHHQIAKRWLTKTGTQRGWATCLMTQLGAIRICALLQSAKLPPAKAAERLHALTCEHARHRWWRTPAEPASLREVRDAQTSNQVTDRYLLGLVRRRGGQLVTFDRGLARIGGDDVICLSPDSGDLARHVGAGRSQGIWSLLVDVAIVTAPAS